MRISVGKDGSIIEKLKEMLEEYLKKTEPEYYPPVENLLDLIYEHYTENNPVEKNTFAGKAAKAKEKELEEWLRGRMFLFSGFSAFFFFGAILWPE